MLVMSLPIAPFMHNNAIGEVTFLADGSPDYTLSGRIKQFENSYDELMTSDNPKVSPHRPEKITGLTEDIKISGREDAQGPALLPVKKGTPVAHVISSNPHSPLFMKCDDLVENKGHQFGVDLTREATSVAINTRITPPNVMVVSAINHCRCRC